MRVAALYDIHGNLPALEAVLEDVRRADIDQIVVGGDILPGPMPRETLGRLLSLDMPVHFIQGNGELAVLAQMEAERTGQVTYWGTTSGRPLLEPLREGYRWTAQQLQADYEGIVRSWPKTMRIAIGGMGEVLFCHGTPRSETEIFTRLTPEDVLLPLMEEVHADVVVCGHTHMQFDRMIGATRVVNAGSVGEPFGSPGAFWVALDSEVEFQYTSYDALRTAEAFRSTGYPQAEESARGILQPPSEKEILELFSTAEVGRSSESTNR